MIRQPLALRRFASKPQGMFDPVEMDPNQNKYQTPQMLFFQDKESKRGVKNTDLSRPRSIAEIKKL